MLHATTCNFHHYRCQVCNMTTHPKTWKSNFRLYVPTMVRSARLVPENVVGDGDTNIYMLHVFHYSRHRIPGCRSKFLKTITISTLSDSSQWCGQCKGVSHWHHHVLPQQQNRQLPDQQLTFLTRAYLLILITSLKCRTDTDCICNLFYIYVL